MFINRSGKQHTAGSIMLLTTGLAFVLVLLIGSSAGVEAQEATNRARSHKAMGTFGGSDVETRSATNEQRMLHNQNEEGKLVDGSSSIEDDEASSSSRSSGLSNSSEDTRATTDVSSEHLDVTTPGSAGYVATTPKISKSAKVLSRYEQGLEDYEEAAARVEQEDNMQREQQEQQQQQQQPFGGLMNPILSSLFNVVTTALSSKRSFQLAGPDPAMIFGAWTNSRTGDNDGSARAFGDAGKSTSDNDDGSGSGDDADNQTGNSTTVATTAVESARYIKGDPLNGYYDFVISEGSYKFWAVFQVATAVLIIYSTFAAIYYSKVSPLTSDYDYIDYLNGGRSFAGGRSMDGGVAAATARRSSNNMWDGLLEKPWFNVATNSFAFVMNAIENAPK
nr:uncharacterized protein LOC109420547 [Aedes albopictus]